MTEFAEFILESSGLSKDKAEDTINKWYEGSKKSTKESEEG